jgi:hypothetical protein
MSTLPKPQPCGQNWLAMLPTKHGRHCGQCNKEIYDFSAMSWPKIEQLQATHGNKLCGMYSSAQLAHWDQQPSTTCTRLAAATALALTLSSLSASGQSLPIPAANIVISGTVTTISDQGRIESLPGATVSVMGTPLGVSTDMDGHFEIGLPALPPNSLPSTISFSYIGFTSSTFTIPSDSTGIITHNVTLTSNSQPIVYAIRKPSTIALIRWRLRRWFTSSE